jgi:hypothetical protein
MSSRLKSLLANTALALGSTAVTCAALFAGGELLMQLKYGAVPPGPTESWARYDETRGWAMKPGRYSYFDVKAARRVDVSINELGLRQGPLAPQPPRGVQRITVLGDSFIFGPPVDDPQTIPSRLQALAGAGYEIVNVSAPGYGTGQEFRLLEELRAKGYKPGGKLVIAFFTNDIQDNVGLDYDTLAPNPRQPVFHVDAAGNLQQTSPPPPAPRQKGAVRLIDRSLFWPYLRYQLDVLMVSHPSILGLLDSVGLAPRLPRTPGIVSGWYAPQWEARWQVTENVLDYVVRAVRALPDAPEVHIAFVPSPFQLQGAFRRAAELSAGADPSYRAFLADPDRPQRLLEAFARRAGVPFIDLTPEVRKAAATTVMYFPREGHFNEAGNALAARVLFDKVISR